MHRLGPTWRHLSAPLASLAALARSLRALYHVDHSCSIVARFGANLALGAILGHPGAILALLGASLGRFGQSCPVLAPSWPILARPDAVLGDLCPVLRRLGAILGYLGRILASREPPKIAPGGFQDASQDEV